MSQKIDIDLTESQSRFLQETGRTASYIAGLGSGKSFILTLWALLQAMKGRTVLYILPSYPMVRDIAFPLILEHSSTLGIYDKINLNKSSATLTIGSGSILFRSAETGDRIRGINAHDLAFDEAAYIEKAFYLLAIARVRKANDGMIRAVGTPCGRTWFADFDAIFTQSTFANPFIPDAYKDQLAKEYTGEFARQELYGEILDSDGNEQWFPTKAINKATERLPIVDPSEPLVAGLDVARFGDDRSVLIIRQGDKLRKIKTWARSSLPQLEREVADICIDNAVAVLVVDAVGLGAGVYDHLAEKIGSEVKVVEYNSGYKANNTRFYNLRAESYGELRKWVENTGSLQGIPDVMKEEFLQVRYSIIGKNKIIMESKDQMKRRGLKSPDMVDALTMTFWDGAIKASRGANQRRNKKAVRRVSAWAV